MPTLRISSFLFFWIGLTLSSPLLSQNAPTVEFIENHKSWGWDSWIMQNGLITLATTPVIGARIMQYDLGEHSSMFVNPDELGKTYTPQSNSQWPNFGGFKNWPAPQSNWNWPPPPTLDFGSYEATVDSTKSDTISITVTSPIEQWRAPDLRFKRTTSIYKGSSKVTVEQTIINEGDTDQRWSIWDVTQNITNHPGETDFENFWVYFPINPNSVFGDDGVKVSAASDAWAGEVAQGVYGVQFKPEAKKIFADSHLGWIAYVDERDGYLYAKTFDIDEEADYPDDGARVEVWVNNDPYYLEVEVLSPIVDLQAEGGSYTFTENWWAAKMSGPVLSVTNAGAAASFSYDLDEGRFSGEFGVFHIATARLEFHNSSGALIDSSSTYAVTPLETFQLDELLSIPNEADSVHLVLLDDENNHIGTLTSESVTKLTTSSELTDNQIPLSFELHQNYPNPFNPTTNISYSLPAASSIKIEVFNILGQSVSVIEESFKPKGNHTVRFDAQNLTSGIYLYQIKAGEFIQTRKMMLIK